MSFKWVTIILLTPTSAFWDVGTSTPKPDDTEWGPRVSFFKWPPVEFEFVRSYTKTWDWENIDYRRDLNVVAGISIDMLPLGTGTILNRRVVITSANFLEPYLARQKDLRIWALGREGRHNTPYRYRVWRVRRILPRSNNPEHWHGVRGVHVPRHDVALIHSWDQMYIYASRPTRLHYAYRSYITEKHEHLSEKMHFAGAGFEDLWHIKENFNIFYGIVYKEDIVDCSIFLPKWWGKFICIRNINNWAGVPNGGGLYSNDTLVGLGCFEIRYNEDRIFAFTDLRYYVDWIYIMANYTPGEYYEYAYPQWGAKLFWVYDARGNAPYIPTWQVMGDLFPLGKKK